MNISFKDMETVLMRELRLYHHPIAVRLLPTEDALKEFSRKNPHVIPATKLTFCQWEIAARMAGQTVVGRLDRLGCLDSQISFGLRLPDDDDVQNQLKYCRDEEQTKRFMSTKPRLPLHSTIGAAVGPLGAAQEQPDVVHFYCDNLQAYHLACDYMAATDTHPLRPNITMSSAACGGTVYCYNEQTFNMTPACSGAYNAGKTERGETHVFIPGTQIRAVVERLLTRIEKTGNSSITHPGDYFPGRDVCKNCPKIVFKAD